MPVSQAMWKGVREVNQSFDGTVLAIAGTYGLRADKQLDSAEIRYMYDNIDRTKTMRIDADKLVVPTISAGELKSCLMERIGTTAMRH